jgi:hypothetical protein
MATTTFKKERPIVFSGPMVRAILEGRKTQTRRICKLVIRGPHGPNAQVFDVYDGPLGQHWVGAFGLDGTGNATKLFPYGQPGDRLWVRETALYWQGGAGGVSDVVYREEDEWNELLFDRAVIQADKKQGHIPKKIGNWKIRPSIHMPRWASRLTLEITTVRVERLQDANSNDLWAEGCPYSTEHLIESSDTPQEWFKESWDALNANRGYGWDKNPWCWVIEFQKIKGD